ncbi:MAG: ArsR/SmtB family transcription factor [Haloarculaceae archaeon]
MTGTDDATDVSDPEVSTLLSVLDDEGAREVLEAVDGQPHSAAELSERCGVSVSAVYRRIERLQSAGLVEEHTRPRSDGHHESVYVAALEELSVRLRDGELECDLDRRGRDVADDFTRLWEGF